jgi:hypothetical protein
LLKESGAPFLFPTGYDPDVIPADLAGVVRLQKQDQFRTIVEAFSMLWLTNGGCRPCAPVRLFASRNAINLVYGARQTSRVVRFAV